MAGLSSLTVLALGLLLPFVFIWAAVSPNSQKVRPGRLANRLRVGLKGAFTGGIAARELGGPAVSRRLAPRERPSLVMTKDGSAVFRTTLDRSQGESGALAGNRTLRVR